MYEPYLTYDEYLDMYGEVLPAESADNYLEKASRHIDTLTFNRILMIGFDNLTEYQKEIIKKTVFRLAEFEYENEDVLNMVLSGYSINDVSMNFNGGGWNIETQNGVAIKKDDYAFLSQTGLTTLNFRFLR